MKKHGFARSRIWGRSWTYLGHYLLEMFRSTYTTKMQSSKGHYRHIVLAGWLQKKSGHWRTHFVVSLIVRAASGTPSMLMVDHHKVSTVPQFSIRCFDTNANCLRFISYLGLSWHKMMNLRSCLWCSLCVPCLSFTTPPFSLRGIWSIWFRPRSPRLSMLHAIHAHMFTKLHTYSSELETRLY